MTFLSIKQIVILLFLFTAIVFKTYSQQARANERADIVKNLEIMDSLYTKIVTKYVAVVDPEQLMRKGIDGMLSGLDPFTKFQSKEEADEFNTRLNGKFGGLGLFMMEVDGKIVIGEVYKDFPADKAGLKVGDNIIFVDDIPTKGKSPVDMISLLRGKPGTNVKLVIKHAGQENSSTVNIAREEVTLTSVPYYGMVGKNIGYLRFTSFSKNCSETVKAAFMDLKSKNTLKGLVLDLRNNPGGLVSEAVKISNIFLEKGTTIVRLHGNSDDTTEYAPDSAIDANLPLIILANNYTQSASEILTGAMQDNDRALVIGQKTFGKGLVGVVYNLSAGSQLVLTVGHYYTPAGRCIQAKNYPGNGGKSVAIADSLKKEFKTKGGRTVKDSDGISPDIFMPHKINPAIIDWLQDSNYVFKYARIYKLSHSSIPPPMQFHLTDDDYNQFLLSLKGKKFEYQTISEEKINNLRIVAVSEGYGQALESTLIKLELQLKLDKQKDLDRYKQAIKELLEEEISAHYYYDKGRIQAELKSDRELEKALEIINNHTLYKKMLNMHK